MTPMAGGEAENAAECSAAQIETKTSHGLFGRKLPDPGKSGNETPREHKIVALCGVESIWQPGSGEAATGAGENGFVMPERSGPSGRGLEPRLRGPASTSQIVPFVPSLTGSAGEMLIVKAGCFAKPPHRKTGHWHYREAFLQQSVEHSGGSGLHRTRPDPA